MRDMKVGGKNTDFSLRDYLKGHMELNPIESEKCPVLLGDDAYMNKIVHDLKAAGSTRTTGLGI